MPQVASGCSKLNCSLHLPMNRRFSLAEGPEINPAIKLGQQRLGEKRSLVRDHQNRVYGVAKSSKMVNIDQRKVACSRKTSFKLLEALAEELC